MSSPLDPLEQRLAEWTAIALAEGWIHAADRDRLANVERGRCQALFASGQTRPLVVGLFGGTGVGKSSLLNRIADAAVARVGVERPTSHEVTLYVHRDVALADLPPDLPADQVRVVRHQCDRWREVLWVDSPDLDSVDERNRMCTLSWLPHLHLLIYVASPERYRDDVGWRVLRDRFNRHGWIFVLNRCDESEPAQRDDFEDQLQRAGFEQPLLLRTCCRAGAAPEFDDEFNQLVDAIDAIRAAHGGAELERVAQRATAAELARELGLLRTRFGTPDDWRRLSADFSRAWDETRETISLGTEHAIGIAARRCAARQVAPESGFLPRLLRSVAVRPAGRSSAEPDRFAGRGPDAISDEADRPTPAAELQRLTESIWDEWCQTKLQARVDGLEVALQTNGLAPRPLLQRLAVPAANVRRRAAALMEDGLRRALAAPGAEWQRALRRVVHVLMLVLPALALTWIAYATVIGFHRGVSGAAPFHDTRFVVSSIMLLLVAWGIPFALDRLLRPSLERCAQRALQAAREQVLEETRTRFELALGESAAAATARWSAAQTLIDEFLDFTRAAAEVAPAPLRRLLAAAHG